MPTRRTFIKTGLLGAAALAVAGGLYRLRQPAPLQPYQPDAATRAALTAIVPAMLQDALPAADATALAATIERMQAAIAGLPLPTQKEVAGLFGLLTLAPTRRLLAGVPDWAEASPEQVTAFLRSWQQHRFALLQSAYQALHDLIFGAWYADPESWSAIGYPGPAVRFG